MLLGHRCHPLFFFCWKNAFEHNKLGIFELKLQCIPQTLFGESTWECVFLHKEMKIIY